MERHMRKSARKERARDRERVEEKEKRWKWMVKNKSGGGTKRYEIKGFALYNRETVWPR